MKPCRSPHTHHLLIILTTVAAILFGSAVASARPKLSKAGSGRARLQIPDPQMGPGLSAPERFTFVAAFKVAYRRAHESESCRLELEVTSPARSACRTRSMLPSSGWSRARPESSMPAA